ncbi:efflux RND transporter periplasmic adaptor subunit [Pseudoroseomonas globiformis]|uniref:Efflux RND transporter periplasmic adaptor subunit n=1 Tax=Teichococcus globiformis TaxID=2307229 RepID=A0ABV7FWF7_9PROT
MPDQHAEIRPAPPELLPPRRRRWPWALAAALVLAGTGVVLLRPLPPLAPSPSAENGIAAPPPALTVALVPVRPRDLSRVIIGDGSVVAWQELVIGAEAAGLRVAAVPVEEGDRVRQGQLLVALEDKLPAAQSAQADAALAEAEAALDIARLDLRRSVELSRSGNVAREVLEQRQSLVRQGEARLLAARARQGEAAARLAQTRILAPHDGIVSRRSVLPGAVVQPGQELVRLIRDGRLELDARVPELDLAFLAPGQAVRVLHGEQSIMAQIRALSPVVSGDTRLGIAHVALPDQSGLRPGMFARAEFQSGREPVLSVPQEAVVYRNGEATAFVLPDGADAVEQRIVATGTRRDGVVAVTRGLAEGERVVVAGAGFLADGDRVRVAPPR